MKNIGLFYGSTSGNTEDVAGMIKEEVSKRGIELLAIIKTIGKIFLKCLMRAWIYHTLPWHFMDWVIKKVMVSGS